MQIFELGWTFDVPQGNVPTHVVYAPRPAQRACITVEAGSRLIVCSESYPVCFDPDGIRLVPEELTAVNGRPSVVCLHKPGTDHTWAAFRVEVPGTYRIEGYGTADYRRGGGRFIHNSLHVHAVAPQD